MRAGEGNVEGGGCVGTVAQSEAGQVLVVVWGETMSMQKNLFLNLSLLNDTEKHRLTCSLGGLSIENVLSLEYF